MNNLVALIFLFAFAMSVDAAPGRHKVGLGESLMTISHTAYGTHQCWRLILKANPQVPHGNQLEKNQELLIPEASLCKHPRARKTAAENAVINADKIDIDVPVTTTAAVVTPPEQGDPVEKEFNAQLKTNHLMFQWQGQVLRVPAKSASKTP